MAKTHVIRSYSPYSEEAVNLLGRLIRSKRKERKLTIHELAERAGIAKGTLQNIEKGDMKCEIGLVFELATLLGIALFNSDETSLIRHNKELEEKLILLPKSIRKIKKVLDDDF